MDLLRHRLRRVPTGVYDLATLAAGYSRTSSVRSHESVGPLASPRSSIRLVCFGTSPRRFAIVPNHTELFKSAHRSFQTHNHCSSTELLVVVGNRSAALSSCCDSRLSENEQRAVSITAINAATGSRSPRTVRMVGRRFASRNLVAID